MNLLAILALCGQLEYLQLLNVQGFTIDNTALVIAAGYRACEVLETSSEEQTVEWMAANHVDMTMSDARLITVTAERTLCHA